MIEIDGSHGEGGGQILRTSLSLSAITGLPFRMTSIRVRRSKPGLRRQHLTAVRAVAQICNAEVEGDRVNSTELSFSPRKVNAGRYTFDVETAGSTTLVFQTVYPALLCSTGEPSHLTFIGGTHNHGGPPWHFLDRVFLPVLRRMGAVVSIEIERYGFAPAGGGRWSAVITPSKLQPIEMRSRGSQINGEASAIISNLPQSIADRELAIVRRKLSWSPEKLSSSVVESDGPGNIVMVYGSFSADAAAELTTGFGQRGIPAETVARSAVECWQAFDAADVPVGEHLADQLLLPMALAGGGAFTTLAPTLHTLTNVQTIRKFLVNADFRFSTDDTGRHLVQLNETLIHTKLQVDSTS